MYHSLISFIKLFILIMIAVISEDLLLNKYFAIILLFISNYVFLINFKLIFFVMITYLSLIVNTFTLYYLCPQFQILKQKVVMR